MVLKRSRVVTAAIALAGSLWKYRSAYIPVLAVAAAIAPPALLFAGGGPAEMQANMLLDRFAPSTRRPVGNGI